MTDDMGATSGTMSAKDVPSGWEYAGEDMAGNEVYEEASGEHTLLLTLDRREEFNGKCMIGLYTDTTDAPLRSKQATTIEGSTAMAVEMMNGAN